MAEGSKGEEIPEDRAEGGEGDEVWGDVGDVI